MDTQRLVVGIILLALGVIFFFNNKKIGEGAFGFYQKLYTKENLVVMFRAVGIVFIIGALLLMFIK